MSAVRWLGGITVVVLAAGTGWTTQGWRKDVRIAELQLAQTEQRVQASSDAFNDLLAASSKVIDAARDFSDARNELTATMLAISKDLKRVQLQTPLRADCRPDAGRLRSLQSAVSAANDAASSAGQQPGRPLSGNSGTD